MAVKHAARKTAAHETAPAELQLHIPPDNLGVLPPPKGDPSFELKPFLQI